MPDGSHADAARRGRRLPERLCRPDGVIAQAIKQWLQTAKTREGICAAAPGGDILFAEQVVVLNARLRLVEPFPRRMQRGVAERCGKDWAARLKAVWQAANRHEEVFCAEDADTAIQCNYGNRVMLGSAILRAWRIGGRLQALLLWDGEESASPPVPGGAAEFAAMCAAAGVETHVIDPKRCS